MGNGTKIKVLDNVYTEVTREGTGDYDNNDTYQHHSIEGIEVVSEEKYGHIDVPFEVEPNKDYYLVVAFYNTGDSFGSDENLAEFIDLFKTQEKAQKLVNEIENNQKNYSKSKMTYRRSSMFYEREDGKKIKLNTSLWQGYFDSFNSCQIFRVSYGKG